MKRLNVVLAITMPSQNCGSDLTVPFFGPCNSFTSLVFTVKIPLSHDPSAHNFTWIAILLAITRPPSITFGVSQKLAPYQRLLVILTSRFSFSSPPCYTSKYTIHCPPHTINFPRPSAPYFKQPIFRMQMSRGCIYPGKY
jgi:hypothetical protein